MRVSLPGVPLHVVQRGNNRGVCFFGTEDYHCYLDCLSDAMRKFGGTLHAYALMTNHVHLLMTPHETGAISRLMQHVGRCYVRRTNDRRGRTGSLWEGRFRSSLIDTERYFLSCQRYIELNPVRAGIVREPCDYRWSSHAHYAGMRTDPLLTEHECYRALGWNAAERKVAYLELYRIALEPQVMDLIRSATQRGRPLSRMEKRLHTQSSYSE